MIWNDWNDFFAMGGYALYVWGSLVVVAGFMAAEIVALKLRYKTIRSRLSNVRPRSRSSSNIQKRSES